jgi:nucleoid-associated protein YgaU
VVRAGDSLWSISRDLLGPGASNAAVASMVHRLWTLNAGAIATGSPALIHPGTRLRLP